MEGREEKRLILSEQVKPKLLWCGGESRGHERPKIQPRAAAPCWRWRSLFCQRFVGSHNTQPQGATCPREGWEDGGPRRLETDPLGETPCPGTGTTQLLIPKPGADATVPNPHCAMEVRGWAKASKQVAARGAEGPSRGGGKRPESLYMSSSDEVLPPQLHRAFGAQAIK